MPYLATERIKEIREELKAKFPNFKFSVTRHDHSGVEVGILKAPFNMLKEGETYKQVNEFYIADSYKDYPQIRETLQAIYAIMNAGNGTLVEDGDYGTVPRFYTYIRIGEWNKPFEVVEAKQPEPEQKTWRKGEETTQAILDTVKAITNDYAIKRGMIKTPLCKCNNCGSILIDKNPSVGQPEFEAPANLETLTRVFVNSNKPELDYWACPECLTDAALMDIEDANYVKALQWGKTETI